MKNKFTFLILFFTLLIPLTAQNALFKPFTSLKVIRTEKFEIIFPQESETTARTLAGYADKVYDQVSTMLNIDVRGRIPVVITPHTQAFNGYYNIVYNYIVLFDTPLDIEWTVFANNLEGLFIHELTHAVSMNTRSPFNRVLHFIFGGWVTPTLLTAPFFMTEGITISFESLDGTGRNNDPRTKQYLRQALYEKKFLTPFQLSGVYNDNIQPPGYYYEYGGLFSAYLIQEYGMEKYTELWQKMGKYPVYSFDIYNSDFYRIFKKIYGIEITKAWNLFKYSFEFKDLKVNENELPPAAHLLYKDNERFISGLTLNNGKLYYIEKPQNKIIIYDTATGHSSSINTGRLSYYIDVNNSSDTETMLVSGYRYFQQRAIAEVIEYKLIGNKAISTGRKIDGLYSAGYFRDGVVGIMSDLHNNQIVYRSFNGETECLALGNENLMFSYPKVIDNDRIAFIASVNGKRELWLYNYETQEMFKIETPLEDYFTYIRNLSVNNNILSFSYNNNDKMYKLAVIDLSTMQAVFNEIDFSGGVFYPVIDKDTVYYQGAFVSCDSLFVFPESASNLSGTRTRIQLKKIENTAMRESLNYHVYEEKIKPYLGIKYLNPLRLWLPLPLIRDKIDGFGILSSVTDPSEINTFTFLAYADFKYNMAIIEEITWINNSLGIPITFSFSDTVVENKNDIYRASSISVSAGIEWIKEQWTNSLLLGGSYLFNAAYEDNKSIYNWKETDSGFTAMCELSFQFRRSNLQLNGISFIDSFKPRIDGLFSVNSANEFPAYLYLFGAYDESGMDLHGNSNIYSTPLITEYSLIEYTSPVGLEINWLGGAETGFYFINVSIQNYVSHLYFNRFFSTLSLRNQFFDAGNFLTPEGINLGGDLYLIQSLMLKVGFEISVLPYIKAPVFMEPSIWGAWKFSNTITGNNDSLYLALGFKIIY